MQPDPKVLVVGTTSDYIDWIRTRNPGQGLFITAPEVRLHAQEPPPPSGEEILVPLGDAGLVERKLREHLRRFGLRLKGIVSFDCETLELSARLAQALGLPHPAPEAARNCRDKNRSKALWRENGLNAPQSLLLHSPEDAGRFFLEAGGPCVIKPVDGTGSELVFRCGSPEECQQAFLKVRRGMEEKGRLKAGGGPAVLAETMALGVEHSCDFVLDRGRVELLRIVQKILLPHNPFGTATGYVLKTAPPQEMDEEAFHFTLQKAASALGLNRSLCMLDFMVDQGRMALLELSPRPGGDCLPNLMRLSSGMDMLKAFMDFSTGAAISKTPPKSGLWTGLRIHAKEAGVLQRIDTERIRRDPRVREIHFSAKAGRRIILPPEDYGSWVLGHVIFIADPGRPVEAQCLEILDGVQVEVR